LYVGSGSGSIGLQLTNNADVLSATKVSTPSGAYSATDFSFTRTLTGSTNAVSGNMFKIESLDTGSNNSSNVLYINQSNSAATGALISAWSANGGSSEKFKVSTAGSVTLAAAQTISSVSGALSLTATSGNLTLTASGANKVIAKPGTNSTSSFEIQNAGSTALFTVNTTDNQLQIGSSTTDSTAMVLILDSANNASGAGVEASGVNGSMYYNTTLSKFRCRENSVWTNCLSAGKVSIGLQDGLTAASAAATNLAASTLNCVSDPSLRTVVNMAGFTKLRIVGRIGAATATTTTIRMQYHTGGNPAVATGDAGWTTLATSAGNHTAGNWFNDAEQSIPSGAQIDNLVIRACIFGGNGTADPTLNGVYLNLYN